MVKTQKIKYLIIGNSAGGICAAEAIREVDEKGTIMIVSDEPYPAYSRPLISEHLAEGYPLERMLFRPPDFYEKNNIRTVLGREVTGLDITGQTAVLEGGGKVNWEKLLLATGGVPIFPRMEGSDREGVFTFTTLDDARAIDAFLNRQAGRRVRSVVIGGGLIGVSVTEALVKRGVDITIVEMKDRVLNTILDEEASAIMESVLKQASIEIITDNTVSRINGYLPAEVAGVTLADGTALPCEMVVVAIGVQPRTALVADTGIEVNRGIVVDRTMATSVPGIYACGDVSEAYDFVFGENRLSPIWPNACAGGRVAGFNMAGVSAEYQGGTAMNSIKYFGVSIVSAGMSAQPDDSCQVIIARQDDMYRKVVIKDGRIVGMVISGDIEKSGIIYNLMKEKIDVRAFHEVLVADDFGLASLPEELWRSKLAVPDSLVDSLITYVEQSEEVLAGE